MVDPPFKGLHVENTLIFVNWQSGLRWHAPIVTPFEKGTPLSHRQKVDEAMRSPEVRSAGRAASLLQSVQNGQFPPADPYKLAKIRTTGRARLADLSQEIFPPDQQTPEALHTLQKAEIEKWWPIIKAAGIKAE
jgi:hypothetical protein